MCAYERLWLFVFLYILRKRLSANARNVTVFTDLSAHTHTTLPPTSPSSFLKCVALNQLLCMNISAQRYKKGKKRCKKNEEERLRARTPQHLLLIDIYVRMLEYECAPLFYSLARNWINSLELPFYVRFAFCSASLSRTHTVWQIRILHVYTVCQHSCYGFSTQFLLKCCQNLALI